MSPVASCSENRGSACKDNVWGIDSLHEWQTWFPEGCSLRDNDLNEEWERSRWDDTHRTWAESSYSGLPWATVGYPGQMVESLSISVSSFLFKQEAIWNSYCLANNLSFFQSYLSHAYLARCGRPVERSAYANFHKSLGSWLSCELPSVRRLGLGPKWHFGIFSTLGQCTYRYRKDGLF